MTYPATLADHFYVSAETTTGARRTALALGPFPANGDAARHVDTVRVWALRHMSDTAFAVWGVAHIRGTAPAGKLNGVAELARLLPAEVPA